jgi:[ribosomal protein S5]-alanine N-acetyltransferase
MTGRDFPNAVLVTERLVLLPWDAADIDLVAELHGSKEVNRYLSGAGKAWAREDAVRAMEKWMGEHEALGIGKLKLVERSSGRFVGRAGFSPYGAPATFELGLTLAPSFWGQGYATEIAKGLANWFFDTGKGARFIAFAHPDNAASLGVIAKLGMRRSGTVKVGAVDFLNFERSADT